MEVGTAGVVTAAEMAAVEGEGLAVVAMGEARMGAAREEVVALAAVVKGEEGMAAGVPAVEVTVEVALAEAVRGLAAGEEKGMAVAKMEAAAREAAMEEVAGAGEVMMVGASKSKIMMNHLSRVSGCSPSIPSENPTVLAL